MSAADFDNTQSCGTITVKQLRPVYMISGGFTKFAKVHPEKALRTY